MIDLIALAAVEQDTEATYIRRERDWVERARAAGAEPGSTRLLPVLPASIAGHLESGNGHNGHNGHGASGDRTHR